MNPNLVVLLIVAISLVPAVLIAVFAPHDALAKYAAIHNYVSICEALVPGIKRLARVSSFPEVTELVLSITWTLVPVQVLLCLIWEPLRPNWQRIRERRFYFTCSLIVAGSAVVMLALLFDITPSDLEGGMFNEQLLHSVSTSPLWLGVIAGVMVSSVALLLYAILFALRHFPTIYLSSKGAHKP